MKYFFIAVILVFFCFLLSACGGGGCDEQCKAEYPDTQAQTEATPAKTMTVMPVNCNVVSCK